MTGSLLTGKKRFLIVFAVLLGAALVLAWRLSCPLAVPAYNNHNLIRLHVIANSDSPVDQALKYQVRDAIVGAMAEKFGGVENAEQARRIVLENLDYIQQLAAERIRAAGKNYPVTVEMGDFPFPAKTYHSNLYDFTLPAGNYEAVRVVLGRGGGANWWCVLFPPLCFVDPGSVVPAEKAAGACAGEAACVAGFEKGTGEKGEGERERQNEREKQEQIQLARPLRESGAALNGIKGNQRDGEVSGSGGASSAAVPAFKLAAPEALLALGSLQKGENAWTLTAGGERVEFRFKLLDFIHQSGSWFKHILGEEEKGRSRTS
ncbi:MAG: stage II sporulation protein R [Bacillota bacterium]